MGTGAGVATALIAALLVSSASAQTVPVSISLAPSCVAPGQDATLNVALDNENGVAESANLSLVVSYLGVLTLVNFSTSSPVSVAPSATFVGLPIDVPGNAPWGSYTFTAGSSVVGSGETSTSTAQLVVLPSPLCLFVDAAAAGQPTTSELGGGTSSPALALSKARLSLAP